MQLHRERSAIRARLSNSRCGALCSRRGARHKGIFALFAVLAVSALLGAACGSREAVGPPAADLWTAGASADAVWLPVLATRDLAVGVARMAFTLEGGDPAAPAPRVRTALYDLESNAEQPLSSQYARFVAFRSEDGGAASFTPHGHAGGFSVSDGLPSVERGVYLAPVRLTHAGEWGIGFTIESADGETREEARFRFSVRERSAAPAKGDAAPAVESRTLADVMSLSELTSDPRPEPGLYQLSLAAALEEKRPILLVFATPAFCHSRACAPVLEVVKAVWRARAEELIGVHVEVFENPHEAEALREAKAFAAWDLPSEPWVFVIDQEGRVYSSYEGAVTEAELARDVDEVLAVWR